jgi:hypothetical protein
MVVDAEMDGKVAAWGSLVNAAAQAPRMTDAFTLGETPAGSR